MDLLSRAHIIKYHNDSIKKFGINSHQALGWRKKNEQLLRFKMLIEPNKLNDCSVLDIGCGTGDLLEYLIINNIHCEYTGIDQIKDFITLAGEKYKNQNNTSFLLGDFWTADLGKYDYVIASGALSYRHADPNFIFKMIAYLFSLSKKAFAFNLLEKTDMKNGGLVAYNKNEMLGFCKKLSSNVILKDDYLEGDFRILMNQ